MEPHYIIKKPLLSEKSTFGMNEEKRYAFLVDRTASKTDIKAAVESLYKVRVVGVNTRLRKSKARRLQYGVVVAEPEKHAIVRLHAEDTIELF